MIFPPVKPGKFSSVLEKLWGNMEFDVKNNIKDRIKKVLRIIITSVNFDTELGIIKTIFKKF